MVDRVGGGFCRCGVGGGSRVCEAGWGGRKGRRGKRWRRDWWCSRGRWGR